MSEPMEKLLRELESMAVELAAEASMARELGMDSSVQRELRTKLLALVRRYRREL